MKYARSWRSFISTYVPSTPTVTTVALCGGTLEPRDTNQHKILLGGDQLTAARARGAQALGCNHGTREDRLVGLIPTVEDWHTRVILLQVRIKKKQLHNACVTLRIHVSRQIIGHQLVKQHSSVDKGT